MESNESRIDIISDYKPGHAMLGVKWIEMLTYGKMNMLTYSQTKQHHIEVIKKSVRSLVQDYLSNQARTRLERLLSDSSQYYKV